MATTDTVLMAHGSGGTMMRDIIEQLFFEAYAGETLKAGDDAAVLPIPAERLAFSTDTFVVTPHFFPGGDIGHLAVCGTVNDVATSGAIPRYLSCGFVLEEGYPLENLRRICASMAATAKEAGVEIVTLLPISTVVALKLGCVAGSCHATSSVTAPQTRYSEAVAE